MRYLFHYLMGHGGAFFPLVFLQFGFDFGGLGGIISGFFASIVTFLLEAVTFLWNVLVYVAQYVWGALNFLANFFYGLFQDVRKAFDWLWKGGIRSLLVKAFNWYLKARAWLEKTLKPITDFIKRIRKLYDDYFNRYVKPVLNLIRHIRQVLAVLTALHVKWAKRLDDNLALVEKKIADSYTLLRKYINLAITWIDIVVDPLGILRRNPLFAAILRSAGEMVNLLDQAAMRPLTQAELDRNHADLTRYTIAQQKANFTDYYANRKVPPQTEASRQRFLVELKAIQQGTTPANE